MTRGVIFKGYSEQLWQFHFLFDFTKSCFECTFLYAIINHHVIIIWLGSHGGYGRQVVGGCQQCRQFHFIPYFPSIISSLFPRQLFLLHYILLLIVKGLNILLPQNYPFLSLYVLLLILESILIAILIFFSKNSPTFRSPFYSGQGVWVFILILFFITFHRKA